MQDISFSAHRVWARKAAFGVMVLAGSLLLGLSIVELGSRSVSSAQARVRADLASLTFPAYARQKIVYQVNESGGWFGRGYDGLLGSLRNHVAAVGADNVDLRVVLHGKGVDLLRRPDQRTRAALDKLRAQGVRFLVCRNTLIETGTEPVDLYGFRTQDIVLAGVAEIAALQAQGFIYIHL